MALKTLPNIRCSLFVGADAYIYNFSYSFIPQEGVKISLFFVNPTGIYVTGNIINLRQPVTITIGANTLPMYALKFDESRSSSQRVLRVDFIDSTFLLRNSYVVLVGQGCGQNVHPLGRPVDSRTAAERLSTSPDKTARRIQALTQFDDLEYTFDEFLTVMGRVFTVAPNALYDHTITKGFTGSFQDVLDAWCSYFNLSYFFEAGTLRIVTPSKLGLTFPEVPVDALESHYSESAEGTFTKTACAYFRQEGGQFTVPTADANSDQNASTITFTTFYPAGYEVGLVQQAVDLNQVAAAQYGQKYWFLYNYAMGTAQTECGWTRISIVDIPPTTSISQTVLQIVGAPNGGIATLNTDTFNQKFQFYKTYGESLAGRYYLSPQRADIVGDKNYEWFDQTTTINFKLSDLKNPLSIDTFQEGITATDGIIPGTEINKFFTGLKANGNRLVYRDNRQVDLTTPFTLSQASQNLVNQLYAALVEGSFGSVALDFSEISSTAEYVVFRDQTVTFASEQTTPTTLPAITPEQLTLFKPQYNALLAKGVNKSAFVGQSQDELQLDTATGPTIISNTSTIKTKSASNTVVYYSKYEQCNSETSQGDSSKCFSHVFIPRQVSADIPVTFGVSKSSKKIYKLERDLTYVKSYTKSDILRTLATPQFELTKTLTFSLNYLPDSILPVNYLSRGLTSFSIDISDNGLRAAYSFSNSILRVPIAESFIEKLESNMKNSWLRTYRPDQSIGS